MHTDVCVVLGSLSLASRLRRHTVGVLVTNAYKLDTNIVVSIFNFLLTTLTFDLSDFNDPEDQRLHH